MLSFPQHLKAKLSITFYSRDLQPCSWGATVLQLQPCCNTPVRNHQVALNTLISWPRCVWLVVAFQEQGWRPLFYSLTILICPKLKLKVKIRVTTDKNLQNTKSLLYKYNNQHCTMSRVLLQYNRFFFNHTFPSAEQSTAKKHGARTRKWRMKLFSKHQHLFLHGIVNMVHEITWKLYAKMFKLLHFVIIWKCNLKVPSTR